MHGVRKLLSIFLCFTVDEWLRMPVCEHEGGNVSLCLCVPVYLSGFGLCILDHLGTQLNMVWYIGPPVHC